uniref:Uncharacterized protein n=1 Tax=viral metagenome TaxID=1070528 RepID=A0A6C0EQH3_9ZZZZ
MGIYTNGTIFGLRIYNFKDDFSNTLFEKKYDQIMSPEEMNEAYLFYTGLNNKNKIKFQIYTECTSTHNLYNNASFMMWYPLSLDSFLEKFTF